MKKIIAIVIASIALAIVIPMFMDTGPRQPSPKQAAIKRAQDNLKIIKLLENYFYADNGEYAPKDALKNGTLNGIANIQAYFKNLKLSAQDEMKFSYSMSYTVEAGKTAGFEAYAKGKEGTIVEGISLSLNQDNKRSWAQTDEGTDDY